MKAWIARDEDGECEVFRQDPQWHEATGFFTGIRSGLFHDEIEDIAESLHLPPGHKQPIELTATPLGDAERGGEG